MSRREKTACIHNRPRYGYTHGKNTDAGYHDQVYSWVDMGPLQYMKMWEYGPGVMVFQPQNKERSMFFFDAERNACSARRV